MSEIPIGSDDRDGGKWCEALLNWLYTGKIKDFEGRHFGKALFQIEIDSRKSISKIRLERSTQKNEICRSAETDLLKSRLNDRFQFGQITKKINRPPGSI